ncbi:LAFA_0B03994g1_1 [Lachancea sp. 'fantastica']|nr:LAFA_0B03994g1_1 [Lachancea sp. 'fantastica']
MGEGFNVYTGRGGAGNIVSSSEKPSPKIVPQGSQTPSLLQPVFSTGRGGAGNMRKNVDKNLTRKAQDVEDFIPPVDENDRSLNLDSGLESTKSPKSDSARPQRSGRDSLKAKSSRPENLPPQSVSIGRGGAGNILSPSNSRKSKSGSKDQKRAHKTSFWHNVKSLFK